MEMNSNRTFTSIAFIGAGRLATGLALALTAAGERVVATASRSPASASKLAARIPGCKAVAAGEAALAGPISRGDVGTVRRNLEGIAGVDEPTLALYRELARRMLPLAIERGSLTAAQAEALRELLERKN